MPETEHATRGEGKKERKQGKVSSVSAEHLEWLQEVRDIKGLSDPKYQELKQSFARIMGIEDDPTRLKLAFQQRNDRILISIAREAAKPIQEEKPSIVPIGQMEIGLQDGQILGIQRQALSGVELQWISEYEDPNKVTDEQAEKLKETVKKILGMSAEQSIKLDVHTYGRGQRYQVDVIDDATGAILTTTNFEMGTGMWRHPKANAESGKKQEQSGERKEAKTARDTLYVTKGGHRLYLTPAQKEIIQKAEQMGCRIAEPTPLRARIPGHTFIYYPGNDQPQNIMTPHEGETLDDSFGIHAQRVTSALEAYINRAQLKEHAEAVSRPIPMSVLNALNKAKTIADLPQKEYEELRTIASTTLQVGDNAEDLKVQLVKQQEMIYVQIGREAVKPSRKETSMVTIGSIAINPQSGRIESLQRFALSKTELDLLRFYDDPKKVTNAQVEQIKWAVKSMLGIPQEKRIKLQPSAFGREAMRYSIDVLDADTDKKLHEVNVEMGTGKKLE